MQLASLGDGLSLIEPQVYEVQANQAWGIGPDSRVILRNILPYCHSCLLTSDLLSTMHTRFYCLADSQS